MESRVVGSRRWSQSTEKRPIFKAFEHTAWWFDTSLTPIFLKVRKGSWYYRIKWLSRSRLVVSASGFLLYAVFFETISSDSTFEKTNFEIIFLSEPFRCINKHNNPRRTAYVENYNTKKRFFMDLYKKTEHLLTKQPTKVKI